MQKRVEIVMMYLKHLMIMVMWMSLIPPSKEIYESPLPDAQRYRSFLYSRQLAKDDPKDLELKEYRAELIRLKTLISERKLKTPKLKQKRGDGKQSDSEEDGKDVGESQSKLRLEQAKLLEMEKQETEELARKVEEIERKLVKGDKNIVDAMDETLQELEKRKAEIAERKVREEELQKKFEQEAEVATGLRETFSTLQQEVEYKSQKLKDSYQEWQQLKNDMKSSKVEHSIEMQDLQNYQSELVKFLRLKCLLLDNFIPPEDRVKFFNEAVFNEKLNTWTFVKPEVNFDIGRPIANPENRRPISEFGVMMSSKCTNSRYRSENVLALNLDKHVKTTQIYTAPELSPHLKDVLMRALRSETHHQPIDVIEPPQSFQPKNFSRRELEKRFERASKSVSEVLAPNTGAAAAFQQPTRQCTRERERVRSSFPAEQRTATRRGMSGRQLDIYLPNATGTARSCKPGSKSRLL